MQERVKKLLLEANKLIFVKQYGEAEALLENILRLPEGAGDVLVHMRRVELAAMLGKLPRLRTDYRDKDAGIGYGGTFVEPQVRAIGAAMVEQHGEMVPAAESVETYQRIIREVGSTSRLAAGCFYGIGYAMETQGNIDRAVFNYEQAIAVDPEWYPALFGLSQLFYQKDDERRGDQFFFQFEQAAPYNVYGNFETHRKLSQEFIQLERYNEAEAAVTALSSWWLDNKGSCPPEVQVYEGFATARISELQGDPTLATQRSARARVLALQILEDSESAEGVLYFVAKVLEEFGEKALSLDYYKRILRRTGRNPAMVQKIGGQFLAQGQFKLAKDLFQDAWEANPDHPEIRFCLLVANLKLNNVNVEEYLIGRERLRQLVDNPSDKVELLALLHSLMAKFQGDADVHGHVGDVYQRLGNLSRAETHYRKMFEIDGRARHTALKYATWLMQHGDPDVAMEILQGIRVDAAVAASSRNERDEQRGDGRDKAAETRTEIEWLKSNYHARKHEYAESLELLRRVLATDPWNVSYLVQEAVCLAALAFSNRMKLERNPVNGQAEIPVDADLQSLAAGHESDVKWAEFDAATVDLERNQVWELAYVRRKLRFLYANGIGNALEALVYCGCRNDPVRGAYDIIRLLNTNFDSPDLYWALGILFREQWQLETASMWFEQTLRCPGLDSSLQRRVSLELADTYVWRNFSLPKAIEYAKLSLDMGDRASGRPLMVLAHAYLRSGQIRQAQVYLDQIGEAADTSEAAQHEATYLKGLLQYRNGARQQANKIWKPLLTVRTESIRFHNIKQEIMRYYFDGAPYQRTLLPPGRKAN